MGGDARPFLSPLGIHPQHPERDDVGLPGGLAGKFVDVIDDRPVLRGRQAHQRRRSGADSRQFDGGVPRLGGGCGRRRSRCAAARDDLLQDVPAQLGGLGQEAVRARTVDVGDLAVVVERVRDIRPRIAVPAAIGDDEPVPVAAVGLVVNERVAPGGARQQAERREGEAVDEPRARCTAHGKMRRRATAIVRSPVRCRLEATSSPSRAQCPGRPGT